MEFQTANPATGQNLKAYEYQSYSDLEKQLQNAQRDFSLWKKSSLAERSQVLTKLGQNLRARKDEIVKSVSTEMGKLEGEAKAEVDKCILACEYYAKNGPRALSPQPVKTEFAHSSISFQPLGVILSIMPWNFPLWQVIRFAAPAVMAGNTILLKHADITTGTGQLIATCFEGLVPNSGVQLLRSIIADHKTCEQLIAHPLIRGVTFTGSGRGRK